MKNLMDFKIENELLLQVKKPTRYSGNEVNAIKKEWRPGMTKVALVFPDLYEIGMSHLGLKILYHILNKRADLVAERVFAPALDLDNLLRAEGLPLFSLESKRPLSDFDLIGFTLQYEMAFSNILNILDLAGFPLYAKDRDNSYPLVIGGGSGVCNPEPIAPFFDCFLIGDGEELFADFIEIWQAAKKAGFTKKDTLKRLAALEGVYVPAFYDIEYAADGTVCEFAVNEPGIKEKVSRVFIRDLEETDYPTKFIVPFMDIVHDRLNVEINRGCSRGCRFCQAGMFYRPVRNRSLKKIRQLAAAGLKETGYEDLSVLSLCASDYPKIGELITQLVYDLQENRVAVSFPSLRFDSFFVELASKIKEIKKTGLTFALEAATQRLRNVINKGNDETDLIALLEKLWSLGWRSVKVYFMVGLPTETSEDIKAIPALVKKLRKHKKGKADVKVNVTPFIPKPHTPFQWEPFAPLSELREKLDYLHHSLRKNVHSNILPLSLLEAAFSRGDRRLAPVIVSAFEKGARFDQWREHFNFIRWQESFAEAGIDLEAYASRRFELNARLAWDHIDLGVSKDFLVGEWQRAQKAELTPDCLLAGCQNCGVCDSEALAVLGRKMEDYQPRRPQTKPNPNLSLGKVRVRYTKKAAAALLSHLDIVRIFRRAIRRAELPLCFSRGFSPQPKISFGIPLAVGCESVSELLDLELCRPLALTTIKERLTQEMPMGIEILEVKQIRLGEMALTRGAHVVTYEATLESPLAEEEVKERIRRIIMSESLPFTRRREKKVQELNLRPFIKTINVANSTNGKKLQMELIYNDRGTTKPEEILQLIFGEEFSGLRLCRTNVDKLWGGNFV